jgi:hypothetical protein
VKVFWIHTTVAPASRIPAAKRLMLGTIPDAYFTADGMSASTNAFCMSTTSSAVREASISS